MKNLIFVLIAALLLYALSVILTFYDITFDFGIYIGFYIFLICVYFLFRK
jgi:hypothetical protein